MRNSHTDKGSSAGRIVLSDELLELGGPVASRLVGSGVEGVSQARPSNSYSIMTHSSLLPRIHISKPLTRK